MPVTTNIKVSVDALQTGSIDLATLSAPHSLSYTKLLTSGTAAGQGDVVWSDVRTIAASSNDDLDLAGTLVGAFGTTTTFVRVKSIMIVADAANTNNVVIGNAAATQFVGPFGAATHTITLKPGAAFFICDPGATAWAVSAGSTDLLRIANSGAGSTVNYSIVIVGASA